MEDIYNQVDSHAIHIAPLEWQLTLAQVPKALECVVHIYAYQIDMERIWQLEIRHSYPYIHRPTCCHEWKENIFCTAIADG